MNPVGYPLATMIAYGPNLKTATKLVVSVFKKPNQKDPVAMEKWIVQGGDIRQDPTVMGAVADLLNRHHAAKTVTYSRILGCPHEEGVDYPLGAVCPHCPFWANLDRHTLEPKSLDLPLTPEQILAGLSIERDEQPLLTLAATERYREQMVEPFLEAVAHGLDNPQKAPPEDARLFSYGLAFLAKWREPRAYPLVIRWLSLPGDDAYEIGGDTVTEWGSRVLASVCDGNLEPIQHLILNCAANGFCRGQAVDALAVLVAWNERPQAEIADYFCWLAREGLEREPNQVWGDLADGCANIEAIAAFPGLRQAMAAGWVDSLVIGPMDLDAIEANPRGQEFARFCNRQPRFQDIVSETNWFQEFSKGRKANRDASAALSRYPDSLSEHEPPKPYVAPPKIGRNERCPCGSGKKFKQCCGR